MSSLNALENRIGEYESKASELQKSVLQKSMEADQLKKKAAEKPDISLQDALISSVIQVLPGLMGYLASGKGGAALGLQGGLAGGQIYNKLVDDKVTSQQEQYKLDAASKEKQAQLDEAERKRLEGKGDSLEDKLLTTQFSEDLRRSRPNKTAEALGTLSGTLGQYLAGGKGEDTSVVSDEAAPSSTSTPTGTTSESTLPPEVIDFFNTPEGKQIIAESGAAKDVLQNTKRVQDLVKGEQNLTRGGLDIQDKQQSLQLTAAQIADTKRPLDTGVGYIIPPPTGFSPQNASKAAELTDRYREVMKDLGDIIDIANSNDLASRVTDDKVLAELGRKRNSIVNKLQSLMSLTQENPSKADAAVARIIQSIPALGDVNSEVSNWLKSFLFTPTFGARLDALNQDLISEISERFDKYGGKFVPYNLNGQPNTFANPDMPGALFVRDPNNPKNFLQVK